MTINKLAIIGGSGLYDVEEFENRELLDLNTPWGKPSDQILKTNFKNKEVYFLPRHGKGHFISPSNINFRANIDALKQLGVTDIVSVSAVGSLKEDLPPGKFVIVDQFIDRTFARNKTFFDEEIVAHVSMAHPTSNGLMNACEEAIKKENIDALHTENLFHVFNYVWNKYSKNETPSMVWKKTYTTCRKRSEAWWKMNKTIPPLNQFIYPKGFRCESEV